ncbi:hypothetical protein [Streptomyces sp. NPDC051636]|uniref:hypothetical protein n=1 Tax=Streptomyces sp. NPDC051636 TaxID=3365663 RepID=UPI0037BAF149
MVRKSGGLFGAAILLLLGVPTFLVASGAVFREVRPERGRTLSAQVRDQLTAATILTSSLLGVFAGLLCGLAFAYPRAGFPAMFLPGGLIWGLFAGAAQGTLAGAALQPFPDSRRSMTRVAAGLARTSTAVVVWCACVAQVMALAARNERLGSSLSSRCRRCRRDRSTDEARMRERTTDEIVEVVVEGLRGRSGM